MHAPLDALGYIDRSYYISARKEEIGIERYQRPTFAEGITTPVLTPVMHKKGLVSNCSTLYIYIYIYFCFRQYRTASPSCVQTGSIWFVSSPKDFGRKTGQKNPETGYSRRYNTCDASVCPNQAGRVTCGSHASCSSGSPWRICYSAREALPLLELAYTKYR